MQRRAAASSPPGLGGPFFRLPGRSRLSPRPRSAPSALRSAPGCPRCSRRAARPDTPRPTRRNTTAPRAGVAALALGRAAAGKRTCTTSSMRVSRTSRTSVNSGVSSPRISATLLSPLSCWASKAPVSTYSGSASTGMLSTLPTRARRCCQICTRALSSGAASSSGVRFHSVQARSRAGLPSSTSGAHFSASAARSWSAIRASSACPVA